MRYKLQLQVDGVGMWSDVARFESEGACNLAGKLLRDHAMSVGCKHAYRVVCPKMVLGCEYRSLPSWLPVVSVKGGVA